MGGGDGGGGSKDGGGSSGRGSSGDGGDGGGSNGRGFGGSGGGVGDMEVEAVMQGNAFWDDVRGGWLDVDKVREARKEEVTFMQKDIYGTLFRGAAPRDIGWSQSGGETPTRVRLRLRMSAAVWWLGISTPE